MGRAWGAAGVLWGAGLSNMLVTGFLVSRNRRIFHSGFRDLFGPIAARAVRCSAAGVLACIAYCGATSLGAHVPWIVGLAAAMAIGAAGFLRFGLLSEDRGHLAGWINMGRLLAWRSPLSGE
jgi:hypothetical protein